MVIRLPRWPTQHNILLFFFIYLVCKVGENRLLQINCFVLCGHLLNHHKHLWTLRLRHETIIQHVFCIISCDIHKASRNLKAQRSLAIIMLTYLSEVNPHVVLLPLHFQENRLLSVSWHCWYGPKLQISHTGDLNLLHVWVSEYPACCW